MRHRRILILVNTGTPVSYSTRDVRNYLSEFLNDGRVIDMPAILRKILVNGIIVPFRAPRSAKLYERVWTPEGSPLLVNMKKLVEEIRSYVDENTGVFMAMRYGEPSLRSILDNIRKAPPDELIILPLYPQYASSTTGSVYESVLGNLKSRDVIPKLRIEGPFYNHPLFIDAYASLIASYNPFSFDHILFSYHGLPVRHVERLHPQVSCSSCSCSTGMPDHGKYCYKAACYETTRLLAGKLGLESTQYSLSFQSRLTKKWLTPFTDQTLRELAAAGKRRVLVVAPSFVADCLETIIEIGEEYRELFIKEGGEDLVLCRSLNYDGSWARALTVIAGL